MDKYLIYPCIVPVARHGMFGVAVARLHRDPGEMSIVPIESPGSVYWG